MNNEIVDKIQKLLALATSPNEHEARSAAEKANELLIRHNLKLQDISAQASKEYIYHDVLNQKRRSVESKYIMPVLTEFFFVKIIIKRTPHWQTIIQLLGEETNVQVASYVFSFLLRKYKDCWDAYKELHGAETSAKQSYYHGITAGLREQLRSKLKHVESETGLMVLPDKELEDKVKGMRKSITYFKQDNQHALSNGFNTGKNLNINRGISSSGESSGKSLEHKK